MSRTRYGVSPWALVTPARPRSFPTTLGAEHADVVVVGGGLTGMLTATALKIAGHDVVLLDAGRVGAGDSSAACGLTSLLLAHDYRSLEATHGRRMARALMTAVGEAGRALDAGLKKARIPGRDSRTLLSLADAGTKGWDRDVTAREAAGLSAAALTGARLSKATSADATAAIQIAGAGIVNPARVVAGAAARMSAARVKVFERCAVSRITFTRTEATVHVGSRSVVTPRVVVSTDAPGVLAPTLDRHVRGFARYHVLTAPMPAAMRRAVGLASVVLYDAQAQVAVSATNDGRLLLTGGDGPILDEKRRAAAVVQRTGQLMYECLKRFPVIVGLKPEFGWSTPVVAAPDRFPLVGPHRQYPHQLFSFGTDGDPVLAWMASRMLARAIERTSESADDAFGFGRVQEDRS
ncbi:MAG: FAD-binding oxidoreductase [Vicinamibacterales bacterium]